MLGTSNANTCLKADDSKGLCSVCTNLKCVMQLVAWYCACPEQNAGLLNITIKIHSGVALFCLVCCCTVATCQDIATCLQSPAEIIDFDVVAEAFPANLEDGTAPEDVYVHVANPMFDYVPPELISLFVTDTGGYTPSYIYRLLAEYYTREDYDLNSKAVHALSR